MSGWNAVALQELFGKTLTAFELRGGFCRTKSAPPATCEFVDYAEHERQFRAHDCKVGLNPIRQGDHRVEIFYVDGETLRIVRYAAIAGRAVDFRDPRRLPELPHQGVFASAATDDEDFHSRVFKVRGERR